MPQDLLCQETNQGQLPDLKHAYADEVSTKRKLISQDPELICLAIGELFQRKFDQ